MHYWSRVLKHTCRKNSLVEPFPNKYTYIHIYTHACICACTCMCVHVCMCMHMHKYMCVCMCIYMCIYKRFSFFPPDISPNLQTSIFIPLALLLCHINSTARESSIEVINFAISHMCKSLCIYILILKNSKVLSILSSIHLKRQIFWSVA